MFLSCSSRSEPSLEGTVIPKMHLFTFSSRLSPPTPFPPRNLTAKLPGFYGVHPCPISEHVCAQLGAEDTIPVLLKSMGISQFKRHWSWLAEHAATLRPNPAPFQLSSTAAGPRCCEAGVCCWRSAALPYRNPWWRRAAGTGPAPPCCCHARNPELSSTSWHLPSTWRSSEVRDWLDELEQPKC